MPLFWMPFCIARNAQAEARRSFLHTASSTNSLRFQPSHDVAAAPCFPAKFSRFAVCARGCGRCLECPCCNTRYALWVSLYIQLRPGSSEIHRYLSVSTAHYLDLTGYNCDYIILGVSTG
ncbi:hypothetical protein B0H15DRAFT_374776 [Mycena belliarum]|uniref:Uncharacterized protein n=1 Tax=Mycena belliarum TaxID=1033014 RepID=A0AAD6XT29_9AGAR|nr:hypothetical protein B0H15DRAFT_374776 [Mycena belliae]